MAAIVSPMQITLQIAVDPEEVIRVAESAGRVIMEVYNTDQGQWDVRSKSDSSPLTVADSRANALICEKLKRISPHIPIVSEETKLVPYDERRLFEYWWCVDPLDGTKEFLKRNGQFTVNIALVAGSRPILGVVHTPCLGTTHWAVRGRGAFKRSSSSPINSNVPASQSTVAEQVSLPSGAEEAAAELKDARLQVTEFRESDPHLVLAGSLSHSSPETEGYLQRFKDPKILPMGSSLKFLLVAEGRAHIYPRMGLTSEWDTCASQIIVEEAGGQVLQYPSMEPMEYRKENILNPFFLARGKLLE